MGIIKNIIKRYQNLQRLRAYRKQISEFQQQREIEITKALVNEYNLIQEKKSNLTKSQREEVEQSIASLIACGRLKVNIKS